MKTKIKLSYINHMIYSSDTSGKEICNTSPIKGLNREYTKDSHRSIKKNYLLEKEI